MNSNNITDTNSRLLENLTSLNKDFYNSQDIGGQISNAVTDSMITIGTVLKVYPALNKTLVELHDGREVLCVNNLLMNGDIILMYTPVGEREFCEDLCEPCVVPRSRLDVTVAPWNNGSDEWLLLGYYNTSEFVGFNPSKNGQFKILAFGSLGEYSIRFGVDGLEIVSHGEIVKSEVDDFGETVSTEYYTRDDVDELLSVYEERISALEEKLTNNTNANDNNTNTDTDTDEDDVDGSG